MQCSVCQCENDDRRRFCRRCGHALPVRCPSCGFGNEQADAFCGGCGLALQSGGAAPAAEAPAPAAPASRDGDRRHLTVLFCDLVGSTAICEHLDPEEVTELLTAYRDACAAVVQRFDGYIGNFMGDGLLIYFGYPQAHEDDPQRAVHAALEIVRAVEQLNDADRPEELRLAARIGIHTGLVVAGDIGTGERRERLAIVGETPNVAARLQTLAEPGTVVIGPSTHYLVRGLFECRALGQQQLKGVSRPVEVFQVAGVSPARTQFEARLQDGLTPLVGRREELNLLLKRWEQAREGEGQAVLLSSPAGHGKSRLLENLRESLSAEGADALRFHCSPYHLDVPLHPVCERLERALAAAADRGHTPHGRLRSYLRGLGLDPRTALPLIAGLLAIPGPTGEGGSFATSMGPEDRKAATIRVLADILLAHALRGPLLVLFEDLHWADASTLEYLNLLVERIQSAPILLVCSCRPGYEVSWVDQQHVTEVHLKRMTRRESLDLVAGVAGGRKLPEDVSDHILARADGVPLFLEELTRGVLESACLELSGDSYRLTAPLSDLSIPASLQDSLMARLDRLGGAKELAQLAAMLGRTFRQDLIGAVSELAPYELERGLTSLVEAGLLHRRGVAQDVRYEFRHALLQDAAYESLLLSRRRALHLAIGETIEARFPDLAAHSPEVLERHYREARAYQRAFPYALKAGDAAVERYARTEATAHYQAALEMAERLPPGDAGDRLQVAAAMKLASVASNRGDFERDLANLGRAQLLAEQLQDRRSLCEVVYWTGRTHYVLGAFEAAAADAERALQIAETLAEDDDLTAGPTNLLARVACLQGDPQRALKYAARSLEQMRSAGNAVEEAAVSGVLGFAYGQSGRFAEGVEAAQQAVQLAETLGHLPTVAACHMFHGVVHGWAGELQPALTAFEQALQVCAASGDNFRAYLVHGWSGEACLVAGEAEEAARRLRTCLELGDRIGTSFHRGAFEALLALSALTAGEMAAEQAAERAAQAMANARAAGESWALSIALRVAAEVEVAAGAGDLEQADAWSREAQQLQEARQCRCDLAWTRLTRADVLAARGEVEAAAKAYGCAKAGFEQLGLARGQALSVEALRQLQQSPPQALAKPA